MNWKELAKFGAGAEAFHAVVHLYSWVNGITFPVFGFHVAPSWNVVGVVVNGVIAMALGLYAWRPVHRRTPG